MPFSRSLLRAYRMAPRHSVAFNIQAPVYVRKRLRTLHTPISPTIMSVADLRVNYSEDGLDESAITLSPFPLFATWMADATASQEPEPNAMCLSTANSRGRPSARMVLLKGFDERGFVWYTNYESRKAQQLGESPYAALTFWWPTLERSVRIEGPVGRIPEEESEAYFNSRPARSRLGAWASNQSKQLERREQLEAKWEKLQRDHLDDNGGVIKQISRPSYWGGFRLVPDRIEFWKGRSARLHDRIVFERPVPCDGKPNLWDSARDEWTRKRLQP